MTSMIDLAWAAGFLEGEGSFQGTFYKRNIHLRVSAPQVELEPLHRLQGILGGRLYRYNRQPINVWIATGRVAAGIMMTLYSQMSMKRRRQIRKALAVWKSGLGRGGHLRSQTHCLRGHAFVTHGYRQGHGRRCRECDAYRQRTYRLRLRNRRRGRARARRSPGQSELVFS